MSMSFATRVGDELPPVVKRPDRQQLVKYAAGSGDFNPLHFDADCPQAKELGGTIVHGRFKLAALGQLVSEWLGHHGWVRRISARYRGIDQAGNSFACLGTIVATHDEDGRQVAELELKAVNGDGAITTLGRAEVVLWGDAGPAGALMSGPPWQAAKPTT